MFLFHLFVFFPLHFFVPFFFALLVPLVDTRYLLTRCLEYFVNLTWTNPAFLVEYHFVVVAFLVEYHFVVVERKWM